MKKTKIKEQITFEFLFGKGFFDTPKTTVSTKEHPSVKRKENRSKGKILNFFRKSIRIAKTLQEKWNNNLQAIKMLQLLGEHEQKADEEEQEILSKYEGWGNLSKMFENPETKKELQVLVKDSIFEGIQSSILTSYYTEDFVIQFIYRVLEYMGIKGSLNILDPAIGTGNFFRMLPENLQGSNLYGIELEKTSADIAKQLFQSANIQNCAFEDAKLKENYFDLVIGNVPFGNFSCTDKTYGNQYIHDYFFLKAISVTRPGGIIAMITSKGTMDKKNRKCRQKISERANLLCAFRLPNNTFDGVKVTTDILFFQKSEYQISKAPEWVSCQDGYNPYFVLHPENLFGEMVEESGPYGKQWGCKPISTSLNRQMEGKNFSETWKNIFRPLLKTYEKEEEETIIPADDHIPNMSFGILNNKVYYRKDSIMELVSDAGIKEQRIRGMIGVREALKAVIEKEVLDIPDSEIEADRENLNQVYDDFIESYGLIHSRGNRLAFQEDHSYYLLCSLENLDEDMNLKSKADIMNQRTIIPHSVITGVENADDALTASLNEKGCIDFEYMNSIYPKGKEQIIKELLGVIFLDPELKRYVSKDEYLSGNVREKLKQAEEAVKNDPNMSLNVEVLKKVQPQRLSANEIDVRLGATWIPEKYIKDFIIEVFHAPKKYFDQELMTVSYSEVLNQWDVNWQQDTYNQTATKRFGTERVHGYRILEQCLNLKDSKVYDVIEVGKSKKQILNQKETMLAMAKQNEVREAFGSWIYLDYERRTELEDIYNEKFNSICYRKFDGRHLQIANMNRQIKLYDHQKDAIMRILHSKDNSLIGHKVGYGKTYTAIAAVMEAKRLKLSEKNLFVVPNPLVGQWGEEFMKLFPTANILVTTEKDFTPARRREFCSKIATGSYDAVIISHSQFQKIPISPEFEADFIREQISELDAILEKAEQKFSVRKIESEKKKLNQKLKCLTDEKRKDNTIYFEQLGITKLIVDEAHYFKNLFLNTKMNNIAGINTSCNSKRAFDMFLKCQYMEQHNTRKGIVFLTGTPVSNSMSEIYTMQRYLQYGTLKQLGLKNFDAWVSTFGEVKTIMELAPEGTGYRSRTRFTNFIGLPELFAVFKEIADIKVADIKAMNVPKAQYVVEEIDASIQQKDYVQKLAERAKEIRNGSVDPSKDNMLKITNEGKKLALDQRLVGIEEENLNSKTKRCVQNVQKLYQKYQGKTQVIFCDLSTPKVNTFNVYDDIKQKLIHAGIPETQIAFIHQAKTDKQKVDLCKKVNEGKIRILLGSTDKAGTGCNFQKKLIAIHDIDCPWRPSDLEQRSGRIIRQGNYNEEVFIYRYVTKNTFDAYLWQTIENKQRYIGQILSEDDIPRRMQEDDMTISYAEIKAVACGNPEIKYQMELDQEVRRLKLQKNIFMKQYSETQRYINETAPKNISSYKEKIHALEKDMKLLEEQSLDHFNIEICQNTFYNEWEATKFIRTFQGNYRTDTLLGNCKGFKISLAKKQYYSDYRILIQGSYTYEFFYNPDSTNIAHAIVKELRNIPDAYERYIRYLENEKRKFETAKLELNSEFPYEQELLEKEARLTEINLKLSA